MAYRRCFGSAVDDTAWASLVPAARFEAKRSRAEELVPEVHVRGHVPTTGRSSTPGQAASCAHCSPAPISPATSSASISSISLRTLSKGGRTKGGGTGFLRRRALSSARAPSSWRPRVTGVMPRGMGLRREMRDLLRDRLIIETRRPVVKDVSTEPLIRRVASRCTYDVMDGSG